jgi:macrophage erythroblast attacher
VFTETKKIISSLADHNCTDAINWCVLHKTKLAKFKSKMERELRIQEFIGLIGEGKYSEAILYSRKHFQKYFTEHKTKIQKVMMLLAIPRGNTKLLLQYKDLLGEERWTELIKIFLSESYKLHSLTNMSPLTQALQVPPQNCKNKKL